MGGISAFGKIAYNNGHQTSLGISPFEALNGRGRKIVASWDNPVNRVVPGPKMLRKMEHEIVTMGQNLKAAEDRHKSYLDLKGRIKNLKLGIMCI